VKGDKARCGTLLRPVTDTANVVRMMQADRREAKPVRPLNAVLHGLVRGHLTKAFLAIKGEDRASVFFDADVLIELEKALRQRGHIARYHTDAVGVMAREVSSNKMVSHQARFFGTATGMQPDSLNKLM
jgi:hypothetical protein